MQRIVAEICINDPIQLETQLNRAVEVAVEEALVSQHLGILVVRHDSCNFTVAVSADVPFGTTCELDRWPQS